MGTQENGWGETIPRTKIISGWADSDEPAAPTSTDSGVATTTTFADSLSDAQIGGIQSIVAERIATAASAAETLTEDERAYFRRTFDAQRAAVEAASAAVEALGRAEGANASYRDYLWEKYGLGPADTINAESGIIARRGE